MERSINQPHFNHTVAASAPIHAGLFYQYSAQYCSLATEISIIETMVKGKRRTNRVQIIIHNSQKVIWHARDQKPAPSCPTVLYNE